MKKKVTKNVEPVIYIVEDRTPLVTLAEEGKLMPEEIEHFFGNDIRPGNFLYADDELSELVRTVEAADYLEAHGIPELLLGASNSGTIMGDNQFESAAFLQLKIRRLIKEFILPSTQRKYDEGHIYEEPVGQMCARHLRRDGLPVRFVQSQIGIISSEYPWLLVHPDGFLLDQITEKIRYLVEVKTYNKNSTYGVKYFSVDEVPLSYEDQVQVTLHIVNTRIPVEGCYLFAWNKTDDEDAYKKFFIKYDKKRALEILERMEQFYNDTLNGIEWDDFLEEELAKVYKDVDKKLGYVEIDQKDKDLFLNLEKLVEENASLRAEVAPIESDIRENLKNQKLIKAQIHRRIKNAPGGTLQIGDKVYSISKRVSFSVNKDVIEYCERRSAEDPEGFGKFFDEFKSISPLMSSTFKVASVSTGEAEVAEI